jgi:two-component system NtrC family sensor kinase
LTTNIDLLTELADAALNAEDPAGARRALGAALARRFGGSSAVVYEAAGADRLVARDDGGRAAPADGAAAAAARGARPAAAPDGSALAVPLVVRGKVAGVVEISGKAGGFGPDDAAQAAAAAGPAAALFLRAALEEKADLLEGRMFQLEKLAGIGRLVAGFTHEVRNPLTVINGYAASLGETTTNPETREGLLRIKNNVARIHGLMKNLLGFSRVSATTVIPLNLSEVVASTVQLLNLDEASARTMITQDLPADLPEIRGNANSMMQVFLNLSINALQAMARRPGSALAFRARAAAERGQVVVEVADNGPGVPPEVREKIFEPFFTTKGEQGTGLGLYLVKEIVEKHHGTMDMDSVPGQGTTFRLTFPAL